MANYRGFIIGVGLGIAAFALSQNFLKQCQSQQDPVVVSKQQFYSKEPKTDTLPSTPSKSNTSPLSPPISSAVPINSGKVKMEEDAQNNVVSGSGFTIKITSGEIQPPLISDDPFLIYNNNPFFTEEVKKKEQEILSKIVKTQPTQKAMSKVEDKHKAKEKKEKKQPQKQQAKKTQEIQKKQTEKKQEPTPPSVYELPKTFEQKPPEKKEQPQIEFKTEKERKIYYELGLNALRLYRLINGKRTVAELQEIMNQAYGISSAQVDNLLKELYNNGYIDFINWTGEKPRRIIIKIGSGN